MIGCLLAGINAFPLAQPHLAPAGITLQLQSLGVKYILTSAALLKSSTKKDEREKWSVWGGMKLLKLSKSVPQKWRWEPGRIDQGHLLLTRGEADSNDVTLVQLSQPALAKQLVALASSLELLPGQKVLAIESTMSTFIIQGSWF